MKRLDLCSSVSGTDLSFCPTVCEDRRHVSPAAVTGIGPPPAVRGSLPDCRQNVRSPINGDRAAAGAPFFLEIVDRTVEAAKFLPQMVDRSVEVGKSMKHALNRSSRCQEQHWGLVIGNPYRGLSPLLESRSTAGTSVHS